MKSEGLKETKVVGEAITIEATAIIEEPTIVFVPLSEVEIACFCCSVKGTILVSSIESSPPSLKDFPTPNPEPPPENELIAGVYVLYALASSP